MSYYRTCPCCGANLDPGEVCDCQGKEETALGDANTGSGKVEQTLTGPVTVSHDSKNQGGLQWKS